MWTTSRDIITIDSRGSGVALVKLGMTGYLTLVVSVAGDREALLGGR